MGKKIEVLEQKYKILSKNFNELDDQKKELEFLIEQICDALDNPDQLQDDDLNDLRKLLSKTSQAKFDSIRKYFKALNRFPNQSQIINTRKTLDEIKKDFIECTKKERKNFFDIYEDTEKRYNTIKALIEELSSYDGENYFDATNLYLLNDILNKSEITDELILLYEEILMNNLKFDNTSEIINLKNAQLSLTKFIYRLSRINKSLTNDSLNDDKILYDFFCNLVQESKKLELNDKQIEDITNLIKKNINSEDNLIKIQFLIHLKKVEIEYDETQIKFLNNIIKDFYERISDISDKQVYETNKEFIDAVSTDIEFADIALLNKVFDLNNVEKKDKIEIISSILIINQTKKKSQSNKTKTS